MADRVSTIFTSATQKYQTPSNAAANKSKTRNMVAFFVTAFGVVLTAYFGYILVSGSRSPGSKAYLYADVYYGKAQVWVDGVQVGETPLEDFAVKRGSHKIRLTADTAAYETGINFVSGFPVLIKRDLGVDQIFSAGLDLWMEKSTAGLVLSVISEPASAVVFIDGAEMGATPYSTDKLTEGAYEIRLEKEGYEPISERINIASGQKVNAAFKLFPLPAPITVKLLEGSQNLYDMVSANTYVTAAPQNWAKGLIHWNGTRGINIMGYGVNREPVFAYVLDYNGVFYDSRGEIVEPEQILLGDAKIAYLRRESDGPGLSASAKDSLTKLGTEISGGKTAVVTGTPAGWLRVRSEPSLNGDELGRLNEDDTVSVLEEQSGWLKIKTADLEGWASGTYLKLQ
ncbi:PEGA domain-containing protein [Patescibacteria group bacterium]|nr:PEGA domain-containing protein [Patescibacteria group bacterium]